MNVDEFLGLLFPTVNHDDPSEAVVIAGDQDDNRSWEARDWKPGRLKPPLGRLYFGISTVDTGPEHDRFRFKVQFLKKTYVIVLDDIGTKFGEPALPPTYKLETSPGNFQWGYRLSYPADPTRAAALIDGIADAGLSDAGADRANRYMRVPGSLNVNKGGFQARVVEFHPERSWTLAELEIALGTPAREPRASLEGPAALPEGQVDPVFEWIQAHGLITGGPARDWYPITCPWQHEHTAGPGATKGTDYKPGMPGTFKCLHGHCIAAGRNTKAFKEWILEQDPDVSPDQLDVLAGVDLQGIGQRIADAVQESERRSAENGDQRSGSGESVRFRATPGQSLEAELLANYVFIEAQGGYWSVQARTIVKPVALDHSRTAAMRMAGLLERVNPRKGQSPEMAPQVWFKNQPSSRLRRVGNITHRLGQPLIIDDCLNIAPPIPEPIDYCGEPTAWLDLVDMVLRDPAQAEPWLDWAAMVVTAWDEKPGWVPMLKGPPGAGKGLMLNPVKRYVGDEHWIMVQPQELQGTFTYFAKKRLVIVEELKQIGQGTPHKMDIYTLIKKWTGRGNRMVSIRDLGREPYGALDLSAWSIYSNEHEPLPLEKGERRVAVFVTAAPRPDAWYLPIGNWIDADGWQVVIGWLQQRWHDMSEAERETVRGNAPMSAAKQELIDISGGTLIAGAIRLCVSGRHGEPWPDLMKMEDITTALSVSGLLSQMDIHRSLGDLAVARALRNEGAVQLFEAKSNKHIEYPKGCKIRLWCLRSEKAAGYEELGQGKRMIDTYQAMKAGGRPIAEPGGENVMRFTKPK